MGSNAAGPLPAAPVRSAPVAVGPAYRALVLLGAYGGLRIGEMALSKVARCAWQASDEDLASGDPGHWLGRAAHLRLRHMAVALWIAAGAGPKEVATRAGHSSVSFTLDRYGHLYPEADRRCETVLTGSMRRLAMPSRAHVDQGQRERRRLDGRDALTC